MSNKKSEKLWKWLSENRPSIVSENRLLTDQIEFDLLGHISLAEMGGSYFVF